MSTGNDVTKDLQEAAFAALEHACAHDDEFLDRRAQKVAVRLQGLQAQPVSTSGALGVAAKAFADIACRAAPGYQPRG